MVDAIRILADLWPVVLSIVGVIVWLVRLEGKTNQTEKRVEILQTKHDALDSKTVEQLAQVRESLARIEGALGVRKD